MTPAIFTTAGAAASACPPSPSRPATSVDGTSDEPVFADVMVSLLVAGGPMAKPTPAVVAGKNAVSGVAGSTDAEVGATDASSSGNPGTPAVGVEDNPPTQAGTLTSLLSVSALAALVTGRPMVGSVTLLQSEGSTQDLARIGAQETGADSGTAQPMVTGRRRHGPPPIGKGRESAEAKALGDGRLQSPEGADSGGANRAPGTSANPNCTVVQGYLQVSAAVGNLTAACEQLFSSKDNTGSSTGTPNGEPGGNPVSSESAVISVDVNRFGGIRETMLPQGAPVNERASLDAKADPAAPGTSPAVNDRANPNAVVAGNEAKPEAASGQTGPFFDFEQGMTALRQSAQTDPSARCESAEPDMPKASTTAVGQGSAAGANKGSGRSGGIASHGLAIPMAGETGDGMESGTGIAITGDAMKAANELHTIAGSDENILPGEEELGFGGQNKREPFGTRISEKLSRSALDTLFVTQETGSDRQQMSQAVAGTSDNATPATASTQLLVEKLTHQVTDRVVTFKSLYQDHMAVMIKPDDHTEIRLQFTLKADGVDVAARVERGDFNTLRANWGQLQQSLADHGIHMGELNRPTSNTNSLFQSGNGADPGSAHQRTPHHRSQLEEDLAEDVTGAGAMTEAVRVRLHDSGHTTPRRWERWA
jgi:hypothetical protein